MYIHFLTNVNTFFKKSDLFIRLDQISRLFISNTSPQAQAGFRT